MIESESVCAGCAGIVSRLQAVAGSPSIDMDVETAHGDVP